MLRKLVITASVAGACALCAPASYHRADAAAFSAEFAQTPAPLVELVRDGRGGGVRMGGGGRSGGGGSAFGGRGVGGGGGGPVFRGGGRGFGGGGGGPVLRGNSFRSGNFGGGPSLRSGMGSRRFDGGNLGGLDRPRGPIAVGPGYSRRSIGGGGDGYRRGIGERGIIERGNGVHRPGKHAWGGWDGKHHGKKHHRRHRGSRVFWAAGPLFYYNDYGYAYDDCEWLKEQAVETGSLDWWHRYEQCEASSY